RNAALLAAGADLRALRCPDDRDARVAWPEHAFRPASYAKAAAADRPRADPAAVVGILHQRAEGATASRGDGAQLFDSDDRRLDGARVPGREVDAAADRVRHRRGDRDGADRAARQHDFPGRRRAGTPGRGVLRRLPDYDAASVGREPARAAV